MLEIAFPVLESEKRARNLSVRKMLMKTNLKYSTMITKLRTGEKVSVDEGIEIQRALNTEKHIEELFGEKRQLA